LQFVAETNAEIDSCNYLFLKGIDEPHHKGLRLVLQEGIVSPETDSIAVGGTQISGHPVEITDSSRIFEIVWERYVAYSVRNESYVSNCEYEVSVGRRLQIYSRSRFLDYIRLATFATDEYPGPIQHIGIVCAHHIIDVVSTQDPRVTRLWAKQATWLA
jgi:hypothetical protein